MIGFNTDANTVDTTVDKYGEKYGINKTQEKIVAIMLANPRVSAKAIAEEINGFIKLNY